MTGLQARLVRFGDLTDDDLRRWRDLAACAAEPNVFFEPEVLMPAVRHLASPGAVRLAVVTAADGRWVACAPVKREIAWGRLRLPVLAVWTHDFSGLEVPLVDAAELGPAVRALLRLLRRPRHGLFAAFTQIPGDGPFRLALEEFSRGGVEVARYERAALRRRPTFTYLDAMRGKRRQELARMRRRLEEHHDAVAAVDMTTRPEAIDMFLALEASGWKGREGTALAADDASAAFFRDACTALRDAGRLQVIALVADGRPVAMKCNGIAGNRVFGFKQAFDESLGAYSPGRLLDVDLMHDFHARPGAEVLDTIGSAHNETLNAMWPDRLVMTTVLVPARGPLGRAAGTVLRRLAGSPPAPHHDTVPASDVPLAAGAAAGR
ncbi:MAG: GNAT family N-acetyltransferase [Thermoleophilia bacterium]|nr:GNAT family N-acetyltransferase [Thermoleophilia bacterium]